jgi:hypothetical protein
MIKNLLIVVLGGVGTSVLLLLTLFAAMTRPRFPLEVMITYALSIAFLGWRSQQRSDREGSASSALSGLRRFSNRALVVSTLGFVVAMAGSLIASIRPTHEDLARRFREHRSDYETLRDTAIQKGPLQNCGAARPVDCPTLSANPEGSVWFSLASWGTANNGWRMSLVWCKTPPQPLISSINDFKRGDGGRSHWDTAFSRIEGDWYLAIVW